MNKAKFGYILVLLLSAAFILNCAPRVSSAVKSATISFDPRILITLDNPQIIASLKTILAEKNPLKTDFHSIQDWVADKVSYDATTSENWQLPEQTIKSGKGDCKDYSTLLCTLWRAWGVPAGDVYVAVGRSYDNKYHAFLIERYLTGKWQVKEPQIGGFLISEVSAIETAEKYDITYLFNDKYFINQNNTIYDVIHDTSTTIASSEPVKKQLPVINYFTADKTRVFAGQPVSLSWDISGATYVGVDQGIGQVDLIGTLQIKPTRSDEYRIVAMNTDGSTQASVLITAIQPSYTPPSTTASLTCDTKLPFIIGFSGWYNNNGIVSTVNAGQQVKARFTLKGGNPGQYFMRIWRAVNQGNSEIVSTTSFNYDGISATHEISFAPSYFINESGTRGYWVDLYGDEQQLWIMPDTYPPRLTVIPKPGTGALDINFAGWYAGSANIKSARMGQQITCGITLSGGSAGQYVLNVRKDTQGLSDEIVKQVTFDYDGTSSMQLVTFSPPLATDESGTLGYYLDIYKDGTFLWCLGGGYPPRITITR